MDIYLQMSTHRQDRRDTGSRPVTGRTECEVEEVSITSSRKHNVHVDTHKLTGKDSSDEQI